MKRGTVVGIVVAVVLVGGVGAAVAISAAGGAGDAAPSMSQTATPMPAESVSAEPDTESPEPEPEAEATAAPVPAVTPGVYVDYSDAALAAAEGTAVLFFHAPWCPQCRALEADIVASGVPDGVTILKVDYDSRQDLRQRYEVTLQTTLVVLDEQGVKTALYVAYDEPNVAAVSAALGL